MKIQEVVAKLDRLHGDPLPPPATDPLHLVLWENSGYLIDDIRRQSVFDELKRHTGLDPARILAAGDERLEAISRPGGMHPDKRVRVWQEIAHLAQELGDLSALAKQPLAAALKVFQKFPSIGQPGAEKVLLFSRSRAILPLDSNGLRVLLRLGFGEESKSYSTTYKSVRKAIAPVPTDFDWLIRAHQQLRRHGQELCRRTAPNCEICSLRSGCAYYRSVR